MSQQVLSERQAQWIAHFGAQEYASLNPPYIKRMKPAIAQSMSSYLKHDGQRDSNVLVYYLTSYFNSQNGHDEKVNDQIERFLTSVPQVCVNSDQSIRLQDNTYVGSYDQAIIQYPDLLTYDERIQSRRKIIISTSRLYAYGGYHSQVHVLPKSLSVVIVSACGAQLDVPQLDFKLYVDTKNKKLKDAAFLQSMKDDVILWLFSINDYMQQENMNGKKAQVRVCPVGGGFFAYAPGVGDFSSQVQATILTAFSQVLDPTFVQMIDRMEHIEFTFFDTRVVDKQIIDQLHKAFRCSFTQNDICLPLPSHQAHRQLVIINCSDSFAIPGNEFGYESVEAEIGNNTSLRIDQSYQQNEQLLDHTRYIPIEWT